MEPYIHSIQPKNPSPMPVPQPVPIPQATPQPAPQATPAMPVIPPAQTGMNDMNFMVFMDSLRVKLENNNELTKQKQLLMKHLFDNPLTPEEMSSLPHDIQQVVNSGDRSQTEMQIRILNDNIQGRTATLDKSIQYLTSAYQTEQATIETHRKEAIAQAEAIIKNTPIAVLRKVYSPAKLDELAVQLGYPAGTFNDPNFKTDRDVNMELAQRKFEIVQEKASKPSPSEQLKTVIADMAAELDSVIGDDGYVSPQDWQKAVSAWVAKGRSAASFLSNFKNYQNPQDVAQEKQDIKQKTTAGGAPALIKSLSPFK